MEEKVMNQGEVVETEVAQEAEVPAKAESTVVAEVKTPFKIRAAQWVRKHQKAVVGVTTGLIGAVVGTVVGGGIVYANHKDDYAEGFNDGVNSVTPDDVPEVDVPTDNVEV